MSNVISISAAKREALGSAASRRLRKQGQVPAIVCAKGEDNVNIQIPVADAAKIQHHTGLVEICCSCGNKKNAIVKEVAVSALSGAILSVDFEEVKAGQMVKAMLAIEASGEAAGLRQGGQLEQVMHEIEVEADPAQLPEVLLVDVSALELDHALKVKDLQLPGKVKALAHEDLVVFHVRVPHTEVPEAPAAEEAAADAAAAPAAEAKK